MKLYFIEVEFLKFKKEIRIMWSDDQVVTLYNSMEQLNEIGGKSWWFTRKTSLRTL